MEISSTNRVFPGVEYIGHQKSVTRHSLDTYTKQEPLKPAIAVLWRQRLLSLGIQKTYFVSIDVIRRGLDEISDPRCVTTPRRERVALYVRHDGAERMG
jgi:hypothetical protein